MIQNVTQVKHEGKVIKIEDFNGIPSTLFLVLWAQYLESKSPNGVIKDLKVIEMVDSLNYNFSKYRLSSNDRLGVAIRKKIIDREVENSYPETPMEWSLIWDAVWILIMSCSNIL